MRDSRSSHARPGTLASLAGRWRIIVPFVVVTPVVVFLLTSAKSPTYESSAEVLLSRQGLVISGLDDSSYSSQTRDLKTQAEIARLPDVEARVAVAAAREDRGAVGSLGQLFVSADGDTDLIRFVVRDGDPELAARLARIYAEQYIAYRNDLDTRSLRRAIAVIDAQLGTARTDGTGSIAYADLVQKHQRLQSGLASLETNATLVRSDVSATRIAPRPRRAALLALVLGLVIGTGTAALTFLLDPRARSAEEISEQLGLPLLGRLPAGDAEGRPSRGLAMLRRDDGLDVEAIRVLCTTLELDSIGRETGVVMVTSSVAGEGKSTTVANLAVALAVAGRNVVLVDLDLRRPAIARLFGLPSSPGIAEVVRGTARIEDSTHSVSLDHSRQNRGSDRSDDGPTVGALQVVTAGAPLWADWIDTLQVADGRALPSALASLRQGADIVLVDTAPLLQASDTLVLSQFADAILLVAHMRRYRSGHGRELKRLLSLSPATLLGLVAVGAPSQLEVADGYADRQRRVGRAVGQVGPA